MPFFSFALVAPYFPAPHFFQRWFGWFFIRFFMSATAVICYFTLFFIFLFFVFGVWVFSIYRSIPTVFGHRGSSTTNLNLSHLIKCNNILSSTDWIWRRRNKKKQTTVMFLVMVWFVTNLDRLILKFIDSARFKIRGIPFYRLLALFLSVISFSIFNIGSDWSGSALSARFS